MTLKLVTFSKFCGALLTMLIFTLGCGQMYVEIAPLKEPPAERPPDSVTLVPFDLIVNKANKQKLVIEGKCPQGANSATLSGAYNSELPCGNIGEYHTVADLSAVTDGNYDVNVNFDNGKSTVIRMLVDTKEPSIKSVHSESSDGFYGLGDSIKILVTFSEPVYVSNGNPKIELDTAPTLSEAIYISGSGTQNLLFEYQVKIGDSSSLLNYVDANSFKINGASISDKALNESLILLPQVGWGFSLGDTSNIVINTAAPGNLSIVGFRGGSDITADDYLTDTSEVIVVTTTSSRAKTYIAEIWNVGGTTKLCGPVSSTTASITLADCHLTDGTYSVKAFAKNNAGEKIADNNNANLFVSTSLPVAQINGAPGGASTQTNLNITITGSGANGSSLTGYKYKVGSGTTNCTSASDYSQIIDKNITITDSIASVPDGNIKLCVVGYSANANATQPYSIASEATWQKDTQPPAISLNNPSNGSFINSLATLNSINIAGDCSENNNAVIINLDNNILSSPIMCDGVHFNGFLDLSSMTEGVHSFSATITDASGQSTTSTTVSITKDISIPSVTLTSAVPDPTGNSTFILDISFSEAVTDLTAGDFTVIGGTVQNLTGSGTAYTIEVTPATAANTVAPLSVSLGANKVIDWAGNPNTASVILTRTIDNQAPTLLLSSATPTGTTNLSTISVSVVASETLAGLDQSDVTLTNATISNFIQSGTTYTFDLTPIADGLLNVSIPAAVANDNVGNSNLASNTLAWTIDRQAPTFVLSSTASDPTNASPITVTVVLSEAATDFSITDLQLTNAAASNWAGSGVNYSFDLTPSGLGTFTVGVNTGAFKDAAGNANLTGASLSRVFNNTRPTLTLSTGIGANTNVNPISVNAVFSTPVTGFASSDLTLTNATVSNFTGSGTTYSFDLIPAANGAVSVSVPMDAAQDAIGNKSLASNTLMTTFDSQAPTISMTSTAAQPTATSPITVTINFSEGVSGFDSNDITLLGGGTKQNFQTLSASQYTFDLVPTSDGAQTVKINSGVAQDNAGNLNLAATDLVRTYDVTPPSVPVVTLLGSTTNSLASSPTLSFVSGTDALSGWHHDEVRLLRAADSAVISNWSNFSSGTNLNTLTLVQGINYFYEVRSVDALGNASAVATSSTWTAGVTPVVATLTTTTGSPTATSPIPVTVSFNFSVTGFSASDFSLTNATVSNFAGSGSSYSFDLIPMGQGTVSVAIPANAAIDNWSNQSLASNTLTLLYDTQGPSTTLSSTTNQGLTNLSSITVTATFGEAVTGFAETDLSLTNASLSNFSGSGSTYTFDLTPSGQGAFSVQAPATVAQDAAGNHNLVSNTMTWTYDTGAPTVTLTSTAGEPTNVSPIPVTFTFNETVTGFELSDLDVTNGTASNLTGSGSNYSVDITPTTNGTVSVFVKASTLQDIAGNSIAANSTTLSRTYNNTQPTVTLATAAPSSTKVSPIAVTVTFSLAVTGFSASDLSLTNATVSNFTGSGANYSFDLNPSGQGAFSVQVVANAAQDTALNNSQASNTISRIFDTVAPTLTLSSTTSTTTKNNPISVTATFSESVTGFDISDLNLTNATASNFSGSGASYTFDLVPSGQGLLNVSVSANAAQDDATNNSQASNTLSRTFDSVVPAVAITSNSATPTKDNPLRFTVTFSEEVTGFDVSDIGVVGGGTKQNFNATSGSVYTFELVPTADGVQTISIAANVAQDTASNNNTAATSYSRTYDGTGPGSPIITLLGSVPNSLSQSPTLTFTSGIDAISGWHHDEVRIIKSSDSSVVVDWTTLTSGSRLSGLSLVNNTDYFLRLRSVDQLGNASAPTNSLAWTANFQAVTTTIASALSSPTTAITIPVTVDFNFAVTGFDSSDVNLTNATLDNFLGSDGHYTFDLHPVGDGSVTVSVAAAVAADLDGNANNASNSFSMVFDSTAPTISITTPVNNSYITATTNSTSFSISGTCSENGRAVAVLVDGSASGSGATCNTGNFSATIDTTGLSEGVHILTARIADAAGNTTTSSGISVTKDSMAPAISVGAPSLTSVNGTGSVSYVITYTGASAITLATSDIAVTASGTAACTVAVQGSGATTRTVQFSSCTGEGSIGFTINAGSAIDVAGNLAAASSASGTFMTPSGPAHHLSFVTNPASSEINTVITPNPVVGVFDENNYLVPTATNSITLSLEASSPSGTLGGTLTKPAISGLATFDNLTIDTVGSNFKLTASSSSLNAVNSSTFDIFLFAPVAVNFEVNPFGWAYEGDSAQFEVGLPSAQTGPVNFSWTTINGSAIGGVDFNPQSGTGSIIASQTSSTFNLSATTNGTHNLAKDFKLSATGTSGGTAWIDQSSVSIVEKLTNIVKVSTGSSHTCAVTDTGSALCWGYNGSGQLGNGTKADSPFPVPVIGLSGGIVDIAAGDQHTCAILTGGAVQCWGYNGVFQLGDGTINESIVPVAVQNMASGAVAITAGANHTCVLKNTGDTYCWGNSGDGQLGAGAGVTGEIPKLVTGLTNHLVKIRAGGSSTCGIDTTGKAFCWGYNGFGQLGGNATIGINFLPVSIGGPNISYSDIALSYSHTCAIASDQSLYCWGNNNYGQLGTGDTTNTSTPTQISALTEGVTSVVANDRSTCALLSSGDVKCWGANGYAGLGTDVVTSTLSPITVPELHGAVSLSGRAYHNCAIGTQGTLQCWGSNWSGSTGSPIASLNYRPSPIRGFYGPVQKIGQGSFNYHQCAIKDGGLYCWGENWSGQVGDGTTTDRKLPILVQGLTSGVVDFALTEDSTCAIVSGGDVKCFGANWGGELGDGTTTDRLTPTIVPGLTGITQLASGEYFTCALKNDGDVYCWGPNWEGETGNAPLGQTTWSDYTLTPTKVIGLKGPAVKVKTGDYHACALIASGELQCWGAGWSGQLGDGSWGDYNNGIRAAPVTVRGLAGPVVDFVGASDLTCAVLQSGTVQCWGSFNYDGMLGNGMFSGYQLQPVTVSPLSGVVEITSGWNHLCARTSAGAVKCWGDNRSKQLGMSPIGRSVLTPIEVIAASDSATAIVGGGDQNCALLADGHVKCWGYLSQISSSMDYKPVYVAGNGYTNLQIADANITEGGNLVFRVQMAATNNIPVTFDWHTESLTALPGTDYQESSGSATIPVGTTFANITVPTYANSAQNHEIQLKVVLTNIQNATTNKTTATGTIASVEMAKLIISGDTYLAKDACSGMFRAYLTNSMETQNINPAADLAVTMTSSLPVTYYSDSGCTTPITTFTIPSTTYQFDFYFKAATAGQVEFTASAAGVANGYFSVDINSNDPAQFKFTGNNTPGAYTCAPYNIVTTNSLGFTVPNILGDLTVDLAIQGSGAFYSDSSCTSLATQAIVPNGTAAATVYFVSTATGTSVLSASNASLLPANLSVTVQQGTLGIWGPSTFNTETCSAPFSVGAVQGGIPIATTGLTVNLTGEGSGHFYSDSGCTSIINQVSLTAGQKTGKFYYKSNNAEALLFAAQSAGFNSTSLAVTTTSLIPPTQLQLFGKASQVAGDCSSYILGFSLPNGNASPVAVSKTITLAKAGNGLFYSDANCSSAPITQVTVPAQSAYANFYFRDTKAESISLVAQTSGFPSAAVGVLVVPTELSNMNWVGPSTASVGQCNRFDVYLVDKFGNSVNAKGNYYYFTSSNQLGLSFNSDCSESTGNIGKTYFDTSMVFYYKGTFSGPVELRAIRNSTPPLFSSKMVTVGSSNSAKLSIAATSYFPINTCIPLTISAVDSANNPYNVPKTTAVYLSGNGSGYYFSDSACTSTNIYYTVIATGTSSSVVYFKDQSPQSIILSAESPGQLDSASFPVVVMNTGASRLAIAGANSAALDSCSAYTVSTLDVSANPVNQPADLTIILSGNFTTDLYTDGTCTTRTQTTTILGGTSSSTFYFKPTQSGYGNITAYANGFSWVGYGVNIPGGGAATSSLAWEGKQNTIFARCTPLSLYLRNSSGAETNATVDINITLGVTGGGSLYSDSQCLTSITTTQILANSSRKQIYFKANDLSANMISATDDSSVLNPGQWNITSSAPIEDITLGDTHQCALIDGGVYCWGNNNQGQLGDGTLVSRSKPTAVIGLGSDVIKVEAGFNSSCALLKTGVLKCWGQNYPTPTVVSNLDPGVSSFSLSVMGTCAVLTTGEARCWGQNWFGRFGIGNETPLNTPTRAFGRTSGVKKVSLSDHHGCALLNDGNIICAGINSFGNLGNGSTTQTLSPVFVGGINGQAKDIVVGDAGGCALMKDGGLKCWGGNSYGGIGDGTATMRLEAVSVIGLNGRVVSFSSGTQNVCAVLETGKALCWGYAGYGELGLGYTDPYTVLTPQPVPNLESGMKSIAMSGYGSHPRTCAVLNSGELQCWGRFYETQLAMAPQTSGSFFKINGVSNVIKVSAGSNSSCALTSTGAVYCWGANANGQLGDGTTTKRNSPVPVISLNSGVVDIQSGNGFSCAVLGTGEVKCWGYNGSGQLGDGTTTQRPFPVSVSGLGSSVIEVGTGGSHACALLNTGAVKCWGFNGAGQLGNGTDTQSLVPVDVVGLGSNVTKIDLSSGNSCAVVNNSELKCWGYNSAGQFGTYSFWYSYLPYKIEGLTGQIESVSTGEMQICAILSGGELRCWGNGYNSITQALPPFMSGTTQVEVGNNTICTLADSGNIRCFGENQYGLSASGTMGPLDYPNIKEANVGALPPFSDLSLYSGHMCAVKDGSVYCAGSNDSGQLGEAFETRENSQNSPLSVWVAINPLPPADTTAPTLAFTVVPTSNTNQNPLHFVVDFNEPIYDLTLADFTVVGGGVVQDLRPITSLQYEVDVAPLASGPWQFQLNSSTVTNFYGLTNTGAATANLTLDYVAPTTPVITLLGLIPNSLTQTPTLTFSSGVDLASGWSRDEVRLIHAIDSTVVVDWSPLASGQSLSALSLIEGDSYYFDLRSVDVAGNFSSITNSMAWVAAQGPLTAVLSSPIAQNTNLTVIPVSVRLTYNSTDFVLSDLAVTNATINNFSGSGVHYTFDLVPITEGVVTISVPANRFTDFWNSQNLASNTLSFSFDSILPGLAQLTGYPSGTNNVTTINVSVLNANDVSFYKYKVGDSATDCTSSSGYSSGPDPVTNLISRSIASLSDGSIKMCVVGSDLAGNWQPYGSSTTVTWIKDTIPPQAALAGVPAPSNYDSNLNIDVLGNEGLTHYRYKLGDSSLDCTQSSGYSATRAESVAITDSLTSFSPGVLRLCVIGVDATGNWQSYYNATTVHWVKELPSGAPTPSPLSFQTVPVAISAFAISMTANTASDPDGVNYQFVNATVGPGGSNSPWLTEKTWVDNGLAPNTLYGYQVKARELGPEGLETALSSISNSYTLADIPPAPIVSNATATTVLVKLALGLNPGASSDWTGAQTTEFAVMCITPCGNKYINPTNSSQNAAEVWTTYADWGSASGKSLNGFSGATVYDFKVKARNKDLVQTIFGGVGRSEVPGTTTADTIVTAGTGSLKANAWVSLAGITGSENPTVYKNSDITNSANWSKTDSGGVVLHTASKNEGYRAHLVEGIIDPSFAAVTDLTFNYKGLGNDTFCTRAWKNSNSTWTQMGCPNNSLTLTSLAVPSNETTNYLVTQYPFVSVSNGGSFGCGLDKAGTVYCWGANNFGQLGDGTTTYRSVPVVVESGTNYKMINAGRYHTCGVTTTGQAKCWGHNSYGQIGDGTTTNRSLPVAIDAGTTYSNIQVGSLHTCGMTMNGSLKCWGYNTFGQVGDGTTTHKSTPVAIDGPNTFEQVATGYDWTCGIRNNHKLYCWGYNGSYNLGDGTNTLQSSPILIDGNTSYGQISTGDNHTCGISTTGVLKCWGFNTYGGVGNGTTTTVTTPTTIDSGTTYANIDLGVMYSCGVTSTGTVKCWGNNTAGQIGDNTSTQKLSPTIIDSGVTYRSITTGTSTTCGLTNNGSLKCWGSNGSYEFGDGTSTYRYLPTLVRSHQNINKVYLSGLGAFLGSATGTTQQNVLQSDYAEIVVTGYKDTLGPIDVSNFTVAATGAPGEVNLNWQTPTSNDLNGLLLVRKEGSAPTGPSDGFGILLPLTSSSYLWRGLNPGVTHYFKMYSFDNVMNYSGGIASTPASISTTETAPSDVSDFLAISNGITPKQIDLTWINPNTADFMGVKILRKTTNDISGINDAGATVIANNWLASSYADKVPSYGVTYFYKIFALDAGGLNSAGVTASANSAIQKSIVRLSDALTAVDESVGTINIPVTLSETMNHDIVIPYTVSGTASSGSDYTGLSTGILTIAAGNSSANLTANIVFDNTTEPTETLTITLDANSSYAQLGSPSSITIAIHDRDYKADVTKLPFAYDAGTSVYILVSGFDMTHYRYKLGPVGSTNCAESSGYSTEINIASAISQSVSNYAYGTELLLCVIGGKSGGLYQQSVNATTYRWIRDTIYTAEIGYTGNSYDDQNRSLNVNVTLSQALPYNVNIPYSLVGTSTASDHNLTPGSVQIPAGQTSQSFSYNILQNTEINVERFLDIFLGQFDRKNVVAGPMTHQANSIYDTDGGNFVSSVGLSVGRYLACSIRADGKLYCWGNNSHGQLGDGTQSNRSTPLLIDSGTSYNKISNGNLHSCGITSTGVLKCWGYNGSGQVGDGTNTMRLSPTVIDSGVSYIDVTAENDSTCGVTASGDLKCWGYNGYGQVGDGTLTNRISPTLIDSGILYASVSSQIYTSCGITQTGVLKCWGQNGNFQIGDGTTTHRTVPTIVDAGVTYSKVDVGSNNACGLTTSGQLKCWGYNGSGQIGDGTYTTRVTPIRVDQGNQFTEVSTGETSTCGILSTGVLKCWGGNSTWGLGNGIIAYKNNPITIDPGTNYVKIDSGLYATCGITAKGITKCWGDFTYGGTGSPNLPMYTTPTIRDSGVQYGAVSMGTQFSCAITINGQLKCVGNNSYYQMGDGTKYHRFNSVVVDSGQTYSAVSAGANHGCGITNDGTLKCWGENAAVGATDSGSRPFPSLIDLNSKYIRITSGTNHTCGITSANQLKCWGYNLHGRLGLGTTTSYYYYPKFVDSTSSYAEISNGDEFSCGILVNGTLKCWGNNSSSQLGDGTTTNRLAPMITDPGTLYSKVSAGSIHACGITRSNQLKCWGYGNNGALGDGALTNRKFPVEIDPGVSYSKISAGTNSTCGITTSGVLKCWGTGSLGQLGNGNIINIQATPVVIDPGVSYSDLSVRQNSACGVTTTGELKCWGDNYFGKLGVQPSNPTLPHPVINLNTQ